MVAHASHHVEEGLLGGPLWSLALLTVTASDVTLEIFPSLQNVDCVGPEETLPPRDQQARNGPALLAGSSTLCRRR